METNIHVSRRKVDEKSVKKLRQQYCPESGHKKAKLGLAVIRKLIERNNKLKRFILFNRKREGVKERVTKRSSWREKFGGRGLRASVPEHRSSELDRRQSQVLL